MIYSPKGTRKQKKRGLEKMDLLKKYENAYTILGYTFDQISRRYGIGVTSLKIYAKRYEWNRKREEFRDTMLQDGPFELSRKAKTMRRREMWQNMREKLEIYEQELQPLDVIDTGMDNTEYRINPYFLRDMKEIVLLQKAVAMMERLEDDQPTTIDKRTIEENNAKFTPALEIIPPDKQLHDTNNP